MVLPFSVHHIANQAVSGVVVGVPLVVAQAGRPVAGEGIRRRRNSLELRSVSSQYGAQQAVWRMRGRGGRVRASVEDDTNLPMNASEEDLMRTHHELEEIEQQMLLMMGQQGVSDEEMEEEMEVEAARSEGSEDDEETMSVGSVGSSSSSGRRDVPKTNSTSSNGNAHLDPRLDVVDATKVDTLHQDLSIYSSSFTKNSSHAHRHAASAIGDATPCYVILFGMGSEETEGIYTLRTVEACDWSDGEDVMNVDTVVAFEDEVDAQRFATLLEASLRHQPAVYSTTWGDITEWSTENAARCRLEPSGSLLLPPESNVSVTDWERALALQRGQYTVLDEEPDAVGEKAKSGATGLGGPNTNQSTVSNSSKMAPTAVSLERLQAELDNRQRLRELQNGIQNGQPLSPAEESELFRMDEVAFDGNVMDGREDNVSNIVDSRMANSSLNSVREELERLLGSSSG